MKVLLREAVHLFPEDDDEELDDHEELDNEEDFDLEEGNCRMPMNR